MDSAGRCEPCGLYACVCSSSATRTGDAELDTWIPAKYRAMQSGCLSASPVNYVKLSEMNVAWTTAGNYNTGMSNPLAGMGRLINSSQPLQPGQSSYWVTVVLRHERDPYIVATDHTDRTYTFGQTTRENFVEACVLISMRSL
eukprot:CAMPEP_0206278272 /NCGR_PEP_ID=MMETSP0047_2-20121206/37326_1 /ASSEMBLY_ACC=CAM_ASM_000192 /TAXON_ID=195065 /ORGANISM="Chroomonas mesostigmatica_cf, Strain CCMP1168" /LENGTH=142 /DNA_ID=CAMNT_0053707995 /DNA_START=25 /DNA_END=450 /DNA_ORIENTATION=-